MGRKSHNGKCQQEDTDYLKKTKTLTQKTYMYLHVHCGAIYNSRDMGTTLVPINGQTDKEHVGGLTRSSARAWGKVIRIGL